MGKARAHGILISTPPERTPCESKQVITSSRNPQPRMDCLFVAYTSLMPAVLLA